MSAILATCPHWCELTAPHDGEPHSVRLSEAKRLGVDLVVQEDGDVEVQLWVDGNCAHQSRRAPQLTPDHLEAMSVGLVEAAARLRELQRCPA